MTQFLNYIPYALGWLLIILGTCLLFIRFWVLLCDIYKNVQDVRRAENKCVSLEWKLKELVEECENIIGVLEHNGDFKNGVTHDGLDEGEVLFGICLQQFKDEVEKSK